MDLTKRHLLVQLCRMAAISTLPGWAFFPLGCRSETRSPSPTAPGDGYPTTGQVKDRALAAGNDTRTVSSIASTGFGLTALCIGDQRGYQSSAAIAARVQTTLNFVLNRLQPKGMNGFLYHFVDMTTGARAFNSEVSSIDTAILLCGALMCRQHFSQDPQIPGLATQIYTNVNFAWMLNGGATLSMGWNPE